MTPNHIFIFCDNHDEAAEELIAFGFKEGSHRVHPNQGTRNRKFYFNHFYLELLWVHNVAEATSDLTRPTQLYERSQYATNGYSPFGLCLNHSKGEDALFENALHYRPTYVPKSIVIEVLTNETSKTLPWTFRWTGDLSAPPPDEPINLPHQSLRNIIFGIKQSPTTHNNVTHFQNDTIRFEASEQVSLTLVFSDQDDRTIHRFNTFPLTLEF